MRLHELYKSYSKTADEEAFTKHYIPDYVVEAIMIL